MITSEKASKAGIYLLRMSIGCRVQGWNIAELLIRDPRFPGSGLHGRFFLLTLRTDTFRSKCKRLSDKSHHQISFAVIKIASLLIH